MKYFRITASIICPILTILLLIGEIIYSNELICGTEELSKIESTITKLDDENRTLTLQIAERSSLDVIGKKAISMGFIPTQKVLSLHSDNAAVAYQYR